MRIKTVKELITALEQFPPDDPVFVSTDPLRDGIDSPYGEQMSANIAAVNNNAPPFDFEGNAVLSGCVIWLENLPDDPEN